MRTRFALPLAGALITMGALAGCFVATPLPLTPIQIIEGSWPAKSTAVATTAAKSYTIVGDTFSFPTLGYAMKRPSQKDWEFLSQASAVSVRYRLDGAEPRPTLAVQLIPLDPAFAQQLVEVETQLKGIGVTEITKTKRSVSGVEGEKWSFDQTDSQAGLTAHVERIYVPVPGSKIGDILVVVNAQAATADFTARQADFEAIVDSIVLPVETAATGADAAARATEEAATP